jgi:hypothetical protein
MSRPSQSEVEKAYNDVEASRRKGWPVPDGPYDQIVNAEMTASRLTIIGEKIPGVLLDIGSVKALQRKENTPENVADQRISLLEARQTIVADRIAGSSLATTVLMPSDAILPIFKNAPRRAWHQLHRLTKARQDGWDIRMAPREKFAEELPENSFGLIVVGEPEMPDAVYWQAAEWQGDEPHETWRTDPDALGAAAHAYAHIARYALDNTVTEYHLEQLKRHFGTFAE